MVPLQTVYRTVCQVASTVFNLRVDVDGDSVALELIKTTIKMERKSK